MSTWDGIVILLHYCIIIYLSVALNESETEKESLREKLKCLEKEKEDQLAVSKNNDLSALNDFRKELRKLMEKFQ